MSEHNRLSYLAMMSLQETQQEPTASDAVLFATPTSHFAWSPHDIHNIGTTLSDSLSRLTITSTRPHSIPKRRKSSPTRSIGTQGLPRRPSQILKRQHILHDTSQERVEETHGLERLSPDEEQEGGETVAKKRRLEKDDGVDEKEIVGGVAALRIYCDEAEV